MWHVTVNFKTLLFYWTKKCVIINKFQWLMGYLYVYSFPKVASVISLLALCFQVKIALYGISASIKISSIIPMAIIEIISLRVTVWVGCLYELIGALSSDCCSNNSKKNKNNLIG